LRCWWQVPCECRPLTASVDARTLHCAGGGPAVKDAAEMIGVSVSRVHQLIAADQLPATRLHGEGLDHPAQRRRGLLENCRKASEDQDSASMCAATTSGVAFARYAW
jgi:hypothetical protein